MWKFISGETPTLDGSRKPYSDQTEVRFDNDSCEDSRQERYHFDYEIGSCTPFTFYNCSPGNANNFISEVACNRRCGSILSGVFDCRRHRRRRRRRHHHQHSSRVSQYSFVSHQISGRSSVSAAGTGLTAFAKVHTPLDVREWISFTNGTIWSTSTSNSRIRSTLRWNRFMSNSQNRYSMHCLSS